MNCDKDLGTRETSHINPMVPVSFKEGIPTDFTWFCEPKKHDIREDKLIIVPDSGSDFWQRTHYGFRNNNGHCLWSCTLRRISGSSVPWSTNRKEPTIWALW